MCTVSFFRSNNKIIITSNRDENINRPDAIPNQKEKIGDLAYFFPKDPQANGTWFIINNLGNAFVLLNGGEIKHVYNPPYSKSRGLILKELSTSQNIIFHWNSIDLFNIEPFTIIAFFQNKLYQLRWNGDQKSLQELNSEIPHIWSSSTLYSHEISLKRKTWLKEFLPNISADSPDKDLLEFHTKTMSSDKINGLMINRNGEILTKNITQFVSDGLNFKLIHLDCIHNTQTELIEKIL
jgi:hypothetical protein